MKRVLIVGAKSYIGRKFNAYIIKKYPDEISITMVSASDGSWKNYDFSSFDSILHLSGIVHRKEKKKLEKLYYDVNCRLAIDVAIKAKSSNVKQFIFMSTAAVYDMNEICVTKETVPRPNTYYGKSKLAAENKIIELDESSFKTAIIRLPMVYGEGCKGNYPKLLQLASYVMLFPDYHNKRSMIHIDNLCEFISNLILEEKCGYFYPQDDKYIDTCEMFIEIRNKMGKNTILTKKLNPVIKVLIPRYKIINKMFSDFYYKM